MIRAIVVDDEKLVRKGFISMMNWAAFDMVIVGEAPDGHTALELLKETGAELLFVDITMPGMSGFELIRLVRQQFPHVRSVVLTCHHEFEYVQEALRLGAIDYVVKTLLEAENADETIGRIAERFRWEEASKAAFSQGPAVGESSASSCLVFKPLVPAADKSELFQLSAVRCNPLVQLEELVVVPLVSPVKRQELGRDLSRSLLERWVISMVTGLEGRSMEEVRSNLLERFGNALYYQENPSAPVMLEYTQLAQYAAADAASGAGEWSRLFGDLKWTLLPADWQAMCQRVEAEHPPAGVLRSVSEALCKDWEGVLFSSDEAGQLRSAAVRCRTWQGQKEWFRRFANDVQARTLELGFTKEVMLCMIGAMVYMKEMSCSKITQAEVADQVKMSRSYFSQCFARFAGEPFNVVLRSMRMEQAKTYLLESDTPVYEIALSVGFEDDKYFSKLFREMVGKYPTEFRLMGGKLF